MLGDDADEASLEITMEQWMFFFNQQLTGTVAGQRGRGLGGVAGCKGVPSGGLVLLQEIFHPLWPLALLRPFRDLVK